MSDPLRPTVTEAADGTIEVDASPAIAVATPTPLSGFLQITDPTSEETDKLAEVWEYIKGNTNSELETERLWTLRNLESKLGTPRLGQSRLDQLYQYVIVDKQAQSAVKLRDSMLR